MALALLFASILILQYCYSSSISSDGCRNKHWIAGSTNSYNYTFNDKNREYIVHIPVGYYENEEPIPLPIIYALPGFMIWPGYWRDRFGMQMQGDAHNFISVITTGELFESPQNQGSYIRAWNDLSCSGSPSINDTETCNQSSVIQNNDFTAVDVPLDCSDGGITINGTFYYNACNWCSCNNDDISYIKELTKYIEQQYCIDITREYLIGFSNGGMMTQRMSCEANDIFAAGVAFHGQMHRTFNCIPKYKEYPMPFMNVWGSHDTVVPGMNIIDDSGWYYLTVEDVQKQFAEFNGCDVNVPMENVTSVSDNIEGWKCKSYNKNCTNNAYTMLCEWNGTHDYPTNGTRYSEYYGVNMSSSPPGYNFGLASAWEYLKQFQRIKEQKKEKDDTFDILEWSLIGGGGLILVLLIIIVSVYCYKKRKVKQYADNNANMLMDRVDKMTYDSTSYRGK